jgi:hypothetical protein
MLLIIELLFLVAGLWTAISGKIPVGLFRFLFGKGEYDIPSTQTRLLGIFLLSPLPASFIISLFLTSLLGRKGTGYATLFELIYVFIVIITSIIVARKARHPRAQQIDDSLQVASASEQKTGRYGLRLLLIFAIVVLGCMISGSFLTLVMIIISSITVGTRWTGNFWSDIFPFILIIAIIGIGLFGIIKLVRILRK